MPKPSTGPQVTTLTTPTIHHAADRVANLPADAIFDLAHTRKIELELPYAGAVTPVALDVK